MTLAALLDDLERRGVRFHLRDGRPVVVAPAGVLTDHERAVLAENRETLRVWLRQTLPPDDASHATATSPIQHLQLPHPKKTPTVPSATPATPKKARTPEEPTMLVDDQHDPEEERLLADLNALLATRTALLARKAAANARCQELSLLAQHAQVGRLDLTGGRGVDDLRAEAATVCPSVSRLRAEADLATQAVRAAELRLADYRAARDRPTPRRSGVDLVPVTIHHDTKEMTS